MVTVRCHDFWYASTMISINKSILSVDALLSNAFALGIRVDNCVKRRYFGLAVVGRLM